jgi:hypothetical protein
LLWAHFSSYWMINSYILCWNLEANLCFLCLLLQFKFWCTARDKKKISSNVTQGLHLFGFAKVGDEKKPDHTLGRDSLDIISPLISFDCPDNCL